MKKIHNVCLSLLLTVICFFPVFTNANTYNFFPAPFCADTQITLYSDDIRWVYAEINGVTYRRKYNYTKGYWIGDWEIVS